MAHMKPLTTAFTMLFGAVALAQGCSSPDPTTTIGRTCVPSAEEQPDYPGASPEEISLEEDSLCGDSGEVCLSYHFQGRARCPYGQTQEAIDACADSDCTPGADASVCATVGAGEAVTDPVLPQLLERRARDAVYCSCRCAGDDDDATYCDCPGGFDCVELIADLPNSEAGSYCVKAGTDYDASQADGDTCDLSIDNCPTPIDDGADDEIDE
jgi:hypothetical protein